MLSDEFSSIHFPTFLDPCVTELTAVGRLHCILNSAENTASMQTRSTGTAYKITGGKRTVTEYEYSARYPG